MSKGSIIFLIMCGSGASYVFALLVLSRVAEQRRPEFLRRCRRWLMGSMSAVTVAFVGGLTTFGVSRAPWALPVAAGSMLLLFVLIAVGVAFSRVERRLQAEIGEDG